MPIAKNMQNKQIEHGENESSKEYAKEAVNITPSALLNF